MSVLPLPLEASIYLESRIKAVKDNKQAQLDAKFQDLWNRASFEMALVQNRLATCDPNDTDKQAKCWEHYDIMRELHATVRKHIHNQDIDECDIDSDKMSDIERKNRLLMSPPLEEPTWVSITK